MSLYAPVKATAPTVCDQCKKRKKSCSKTLPSCSRCTRFLVKCTYTHNVDSNAAGNLPGLVDVIPGLGQPFPSVTRYRNLQSLSAEEQIPAQASKLLDAISRKRGPVDRFCEIYFREFQRSLPIVDRDAFYAQLQQQQHGSHFLTLLLAVILISHLSSKIGDETGEGEGRELYGTVKSMYSLLQSTGKLSVELVQVGVIIAAYEHCQGLGREAWLSIGGCARMGNILGLHHAIRKPVSTEREGGVELQMKKCLWWGIVVLERIINMEYERNKLPFASQAPTLDDLLPLAPGDSETFYPVSTNLITPDMTVYDGAELFDREFTRVGNFGSTIQAMYLSGLVTQHIVEENKCHVSREAEARKLDTALQSFGCTLIPPPGMADGQYCGAYGIRTLSLFALHLHSLSQETRAENPEGIAHATIALQSLARTVIHMAKAGAVGKPLDLDAMAFWAHAQCAQAALVHIKFGERDAEFISDLEVLRAYLREFVWRFGIYENYLREIEAAQKAAIRTSSASSTLSLGTAMDC